MVRVPPHGQRLDKSTAILGLGSTWARKSDQEVRRTSVGTGVLLVPNGTITITRYGRRIGGLRRGCQSKFRRDG